MSKGLMPTENFKMQSDNTKTPQKLRLHNTMITNWQILIKFPGSFYSGIEWWEAYCFCPFCLFVCLFDCLTFCLLSNLTIPIHFEPGEIGNIYFAYKLNSKSSFKCDQSQLACAFFPFLLEIALIHCTCILQTTDFHTDLQFDNCHGVFNRTLLILILNKCKYHCISWDNRIYTT